MDRNNHLIAMTFALILLGGLIGSFLASPSGAWKALTGSEGSFGERVEENLQSTLPLHEQLQSLKVTTKLLSGLQEIDSLFFTSQRLIENLTVEDASIGERNKAAVITFAQNNSLTRAVMLIPTACSIHKELLPENAILFDQKGWLESFHELLGQGVYSVDAYTPLYDARKENLFYRTDSRPTQLAGYKLYLALADRLGYDPLPLTSFSIEPLAYDCYGDLYSRWGNGGIRGDTVTAYLPLSAAAPCLVQHRAAEGITATYYTLYPAQAVTSGGDMDVILGGSSPRIDVTTYGERSRSLLIFGDSDALCLIPFLSLHYSSVTLVNPAECSQEMMEALAQEEHDQVMYAFSLSTFIQEDLSVGLQTYSTAKNAD